MKNDGKGISRENSQFLKLFQVQKPTESFSPELSQKLSRDLGLGLELGPSVEHLPRVNGALSSTSRIVTNKPSQSKTRKTTKTE